MKAGFLMDFQRARSDEQKQSRIDDIVRIAAEIFDEEGFDSLSLSAIAEQIGITRPAIYRYFTSKEAILLRVISQDFADWSNALVTSFSSERRYNVTEIANIWTQSFLSHERMLKLYSLYSTLLDRNLSMEELMHFEKSSLQSMLQVKGLLKRLFPRATNEQLKNFLDVQLALAFGCFLMSRISPPRMEAAILANTASEIPTFNTIYGNSISSLMHHLE